jgi:hypothetical protein
VEPAPVFGESRSAADAQPLLDEGGGAQFGQLSIVDRRSRFEPTTQ